MTTNRPEEMTAARFATVTRRDFENGAVRDEIMRALQHLDAFKAEDWPFAQQVMEQQGTITNLLRALKAATDALTVARGWAIEDTQAALIAAALKQVVNARANANDDSWGTPDA